MTSHNNLEKAEQYHTMRKTAATMETAIKTVKVPGALSMLQVIRLHEKDYLLNKDDQDVAMIHESIDKLIKAFEDAGVLQEHVDDIKLRLNAYAENFDALVGEYQAIDEALAVLQSTANIIEPLARKIYQESLTKTNNKSAEISTKAGSLAIIALAIALGLMTVSLLIAFFLASSIVKPINETNERLRDIADGEGDLTSRLVVKAGDELGELGENFNRFVGNQQKLIKEIADNISALNIDSTTLSDLSVQLASGSEEMSAQTGSVAGAVEEMTTNINTMAGTAEEMSMNAQTVSSSAEQMSLNMDMIATSIEEMAKAIQDVFRRAREGADIAVTAMEMSDTATSTMGALSEAAKQIGDVTEVIKRIADQTNLLALNATIEAASAGDAGKGFAVVANEIKELARQSAHAASDIAERIEGVQKNTGGALSIINDVSEIIGNMNESSLGITTLVEQQNLATNEISSNVQEVNKGVNNIATAISEVAKGSNDMAQSSGEAAQGISEVSSNIQGVDKATNDSSAIARQVNKSAEGFANVAEKLQKMVGKFKVD